MMADLVQTRMTSAAYFQLPETNQIEELIDGEVIMTPPALDVHQDELGNIYDFLRQNLYKVQGGFLRLAPTGVHLEEGHDFEPDIFWVSNDNDHCVLAPDGRYWHGAPDLVVEILSASTAYRDRGIKYEMYEKHGVREYWLVDPEAKFLEVYVLDDQQFKRLGAFGKGQAFHSVIFNADVAVEALFSSQ